MKKRKLIALITPIVCFMILSCAFAIPYTVASFVEYLNVDPNEESFVDETTHNFICYPLVKNSESDPNAVAIGWAGEPEDCTGDLTIPNTVIKGTGNNALTYTVKAIAECGFRFCDFSSIAFAGNNVEEIKSEAFYSCQNMTTFTMPQKCIHGVGPSSFMDCRKLETIDMSNVVSYVESQFNSESSNQQKHDFFSSHPFKIGDHAFASCVKLKGFTFPNNLAEVGAGAFNNCVKIFGLFFPDPILDDGNNIVNTITFGEYAFSDCTSLAVTHFNKNVIDIGLYCFAKCESLRIYYGGDINSSSDPLYKFSTTINKDWRKRHVATNQNTDNFDEDGNGTGPDYVPIKNNQSEMKMDDEHPGLIYIKGPGPIYYDGKASDATAQKIDTAQSDYITIFQWNTPTVPSTDYDATNKILTIPNTIAGCPVKVIAEQAFYREVNNNETLKGVVFNSNLVQICHDAFKACKELQTIDFSACVNLKEIGHNAFHPNTGSNTKFTGTLSLPNSLMFIGKSAFYNFTKATSLQLCDYSDPNNHPNLRIIGDNAFQNFGCNVNDSYKGTIDLVLPNRMSDGDIWKFKPNGMTGDIAGCVGDYAFANCPLLRTVELEPASATAINDPISKPNAQALTGKGATATDSPRIGLGTGAFSSCSYLIRFKGSKKLLRLGENLFGKCPKLKEIFLSTFLNANEADIMPWGYGEGHSIFYNQSNSDSGSNACEFRDLVVYVDGNDAPVRKQRQQKYYTWNTDPKTYENEYTESSDQAHIWGHYWNEGSADNCGRFQNDTIIGRLVVPTYFNVDFHTQGAVKYINTSTGQVSNSPSSDYSNCAAAIKKDNNDTTYIITKCYASNQNSLDLTTWNLDANITMLGSCSFATLNAGDVTRKIILPSSLAMIRDRAFLSVKVDGTYGINIVTYKDNNGEVVDTGANPKTNVCFLPPSVTRIEEYSFFNNNFEKVLLPENLNMLGNTAFTGSMGKEATIEIFGGLGTSSCFRYSGNGIYDNSSNTLLYYAAKGSGTLDLSNETIAAIGARALANTSYSSIILPSSTTMVYGGAFEGNSSVTEISGLSGLKYIAAKPDSNDTDVWNSDANFNIYDLPPKDFAKLYDFNPTYIDTNGGSGGNKGVGSGNFANRTFFYKWLNSFGAFANCSSLETFDITSCKTTLKKIGYGAFEGCSSLSSMTDGSATYTYYRYNDFTGLTKDNVGDILANPNSTKITRTTGVCDLSGFTNLTSIGRVAFKGCSSLEYFHLPIHSANSQANFYLGFDIQDIGSWYNYASNKNSGINSDANNIGIFDGTLAASTGAVLVGETIQYAKSGGKNYQAQTKKVTQVENTSAFVDEFDKTLYNVDRYQSNASILPSGHTYYYVHENSTTTADLKTGSDLNSTSYKYWIQIGNASDHNYLLFDKGSEVKTYLKIS